MATTTRFDWNIIKVARRLKDKRVDTAPPLSSSDTGLRYSNALLTTYENQAIRDLILDRFMKGSVETEIPEYVKQIGTSLVPNATTGVAAKLAEQWRILDLITDDYKVPFTRLVGVSPMEVRSGRHGIIKPVYTMPVYWDETGQITVLPVTADQGGTQWSLTGRYVQVHQDITIDTGALDVTVNAIYDAEIQDRMFKMAMADTLTVSPPAS